MPLLKTLAEVEPANVSGKSVSRLKGDISTHASRPCFCIFLKVAGKH